MMSPNDPSSCVASRTTTTDSLFRLFGHIRSSRIFKCFFTPSFSAFESSKALPDDEPRILFMGRVKCAPERAERGGVDVVGILSVIWRSSTAAKVFGAGHLALGGRVDRGVGQSGRAVLFCDDD